MRHLAFIFAVLFSWCCNAEQFGNLLWDGADHRSYSTTAKGSVLLFPDVPLGGKPPKNSVLIGVIDSGVMATHPQLAGYLKEAKDFTGEGTDDVLGHGTAVALISLFGTGQKNPPIAIVNAKVVDHEGKILESNVIKAIDWVAAKGVKVINLSLGFNGDRKDHEGLCDAISHHADILFVAAAGNSGPDIKVFPAACGLSNLIPVAAADENGKPADYSGKGDVLAPGGVRFIKEWAYYYESAQYLAKAGQLEKARHLYEKSISVEQNAESEFQIGLIDLNENKADAAIIQFNRAINIEPALAEAHEMLGATLFMQGKYLQAEKSLRTAIDLYPDSIQTNSYRARAHFNLGQTLLRLDRNEDAKTEFEAVKLLMPTYPHIDEALKAINK